MKFVSYAQNFEDVMLYRAFKNVERGFYVDVGAQHPVIDSVTAAFYARGWSGVNIEPVAEWHAMLQEQRPRDTNLQILAGRERTKQTFFNVGATGLSTTRSEYATQYVNEGMTVSESTLETTTLNDILDQYAPETIHFLKIDVEGAEGDVLAGLDLNAHRPWILVIEAYKPRSTEGDFADWEPDVLTSGYRRVYDDGLNRFYVADEHRELEVHFELPPNVNDDYETIVVQWLRNESDRWRAEYEQAITALDLSRKAEELLTATSLVASQESVLHDLLGDFKQINQCLDSGFTNLSERLTQVENQNSVLPTLLNRVPASLESSIQQLERNLAAIDSELAIVSAAQSDHSAISEVIEKSETLIEKITDVSLTQIKLIDPLRTSLQSIQKRVDSSEAGLHKTVKSATDDLASALAGRMKSIESALCETPEQLSTSLRPLRNELSTSLLSITEEINSLKSQYKVSRQRELHEIGEMVTSVIDEQTEKQGALVRQLEEEIENSRNLKERIAKLQKELEVGAEEVADMRRNDDRHRARIYQLEAEATKKAKALEDLRNDRVNMELKWENALQESSESFAVAAAARTEISRLHAEIEIRNRRLGALEEVGEKAVKDAASLRAEYMRLHQALVETESERDMVQVLPDRQGGKRQFNSAFRKFRGKSAAIADSEAIKPYIVRSLSFREPDELFCDGPAKQSILDSRIGSVSLPRRLDLPATAGKVYERVGKARQIGTPDSAPQGGDDENCT